MTTYRIVIRVTTTEDFEIYVLGNTREEARGKSLTIFANRFKEVSGEPPAVFRLNNLREERFVSTTAVKEKADEPR